MDLADEVIETLDMLDDLIGVHNVEGAIVERPGVLDVPRSHIEPAGLRLCAELVNELYASDVLR